MSSTEHHGADDGVTAEALIQRVLGIVDSAKPVPLSTSVMINRDEIMEMLEDAIERLPDELRSARWLLREREEYLAKVRRDGDEIISEAQTRVAQMVQRSEVVKAADQQAQRIDDKARADARRLRHEAEDYCDQQLARLEIVLERTAKTVGAGRAKLQELATGGTLPVDDPGTVEIDAPVFDQGDG